MTSNADLKKDEQEVSGVSATLRIPPIWRDRLRLWFAQFEAIVSPHKKGDKAMYELVIGQLERQDIDEIADIILRPPATDKYEALKKRLLQVYEESEQRQVQRLLSEMELGDMKPSQLLRRMKNLAGDNISDSALRIMWTNHLPQSVRAVLAVSDNIAKKSDIDDLAQMADKILEHSHPPTIAAVSTCTSQATTHEMTITEKLTEKIDLLTREIAELKTNQSSYRHRRPFRRYRSRSRTPSRSRSNRNDSSFQNDRTCYYHRKFGKQAQRCTRPCNFEDPKTTSEN